MAPKEWQGGLPLTYRMGGKRVKVHLKVDMDTSVKPYYVVEARIRGSELPDEWVVMGNHRDAWAFGGVDPSSGTAAMMEMTRALGAMKQQGIRPRRTLVICSWDGEEYALTGSTEWGEQYADELKKKAVAYLNVDEATSGTKFEGDAVASLAPLLVEVSRTIPAPSGKTLYDEWKESAAKDAQENGGRRKSSEHANRKRLGSYGVPEFSGNPDDGIDVHGALRRVPLDVRRFLLDESILRSGIPVSRRDVDAVGNSGAAAGKCGCGSLQFRILRTGNS